MSFYMVAGTVEWDRGAEALQRALQAQGLPFDHEEDELLRETTRVELALRPGFEHEWILVGDAGEEAELRQAVQQLSDVLRALDVRHSFEMHAPDNRLLGEISFD